MIKLILTDLDRTFLNSKGAFDKDLYTEVKALMDEQNIYFAPCTGKQCERVEELFGPEFSKDLWILGDSATRIKHKDEYIYESLLPNKVGTEILKKLEEISDEYTIIACTPSAAAIKNTVPEEEAKVVRRSYAKVKTVESLKEMAEDFVKITVFDPQKKCFEHVKQLEEFKQQAYIVASEAAWIDISNHNVHKGTTVAELQRILNVTPEETMAFGDGLNDVELLERAVYSFAMSNAFEQIKEVAQFVTKSNDEDAVLHTIKKMITLQVG